MASGVLQAQEPVPMEVVNPVLVFNTSHEDSLTRPAFKDSWFSRDKGLHCSGSLILTAAVFNMHYRFGEPSRDQATLRAAGTSLVFGLTKELWDASKVNNHFSYKDLFYDVLGIIIAGALISCE